MKNKIIAICFCALALIIALVFCDIQLKSEAAIVNGSTYVEIYAPIAIGRDYYVAQGYPDAITRTDYGSVKVSINGSLYETGWSNIVIKWY